MPELAGLAHLPTDETIPGLRRAGARAVAPGPDIATGGAVAVKPLGQADTGHHRPVGLRVADARHHLHVLGATGSGKSTLLAQLILADTHAGRGVVVIRPQRGPGHRPAHPAARRVGAAAGDLRRRLPPPPPVPEPPARRGPRPDRGQPGQRVPPGLRRLLGPPHRRPDARGLSDPARRAGGRLTRRSAPAAGRARLPRPGHRRRHRSGPVRVGTTSSATPPAPRSPPR